MQLRAFFKYFGSKHSSIPMYPSPKHSCIIEPFAGSAGYATYYHENDVILNELDTDIYLLWKWLIAEATPNDIRMLPIELKQGTDIRVLDIPYEAKVLIRLWQRVGRNSCWAVSVWNNRPKGDMWSVRTRNRIAAQLQYIRHWRVTNTSYESVVQDAPATWFIDPPYSIQSFKYGSCPPINYDDLGTWCHSRLGQVIVCEANNAQWLSFRKQHQVNVGRVIKGREAKRDELVWVNDPEYMKKLADRKPIVMGNVFDMR